MKTLKEYLDAPGGREQLDADIYQVLDYLDFEKIEKVMKVLNWGWAIIDKDPDELLYAGYKVFEDDTYIPKAKDIMLMAQKIIKTTINDALESEANGEFTKKFMLNTGGFHCEIEILDDEERKYFSGEDAPDDFEHSVDITLKFCVEDYMGKFV